MPARGGRSVTAYAAICYACLLAGLQEPTSGSPGRPLVLVSRPSCQNAAQNRLTKPDCAGGRWGGTLCEDLSSSRHSSTGGRTNRHGNAPGGSLGATMQAAEAAAAELNALLLAAQAAEKAASARAARWGSLPR